MVNARSCPRGLALRADTIARSFAGERNDLIARDIDCERHTVGVWRKRWRAAFDSLVRVECEGKPAELRAAIREVLGDQPRPGRRGTFTSEQIARIIAVACEPPADSGRPVSHWTAREVAQEAVLRKIVPKISARQVGRFLKGGGAPPAP